MTLHVLAGDQVTTTFEIHLDLIEDIVATPPHVLHRRPQSTERARRPLDTPNPT